MAFSTIIKPSDYFNPKLYTGNYSTNAVTGVGFQPDLTWIKTRTTAGENHYLFDVIRGVTKYLHSDTSAAQGTNAATLTTFGSDGCKCSLKGPGLCGTHSQRNFVLSAPH